MNLLTLPQMISPFRIKSIVTTLSVSSGPEPPLGLNCHYNCLTWFNWPRIKSPLQYIVSLQNDCWTGRKLGKAATSHQHSYWGQVDESGSRHPLSCGKPSQEAVLSDYEYLNLRQMNGVSWVSWSTKSRIRSCLEVSVLLYFPLRELICVPYVCDTSRRSMTMRGPLSYKSYTITYKKYIHYFLPIVL